METELTKIKKNTLHFKMVSGYDPDLYSPYEIGIILPKNVLELINFSVPYIKITFPASVPVASRKVTAIKLYGYNDAGDWLGPFTYSSTEVAAVGDTIEITGIDLTKMCKGNGIIRPFIGITTANAYPNDPDNINIIKMECIYATKD